MNLATKLKDKIKAGKSVVGTFSKTNDPAFVEVAGYAGFDFIILDMEHGPTNPFLLQNLIRAAEVSKITPIVRVQSISEDIGKVLDVGAAGIQVPQVKNAEEARRAISLAKFAPLGERGVCRYVRAANYSSMDKFSYFQNGNDVIVILQLEGTEAIKNLNEILKVEGIDIIFIGPYDLSQALGVIGDVTHPLVEDKIKEIIETCKIHEITVGIFSDSIENAKRWREIGVQYLSYSVDVGIFFEACSQKVKEILEVNGLPPLL